MWVCGWCLVAFKMRTGLSRQDWDGSLATQTGGRRCCSSWKDQSQICSLWTSWTNQSKEERLIGGHMSWACCAEIKKSFHCDTLKQREKSVHMSDRFCIFVMDSLWSPLIWVTRDIGDAWGDQIGDFSEILKSTNGFPDDCVSPLCRKMRVVIHRARYSQLSQEKISPRKKHWSHWLKIEIYSSLHWFCKHCTTN